MFYFTVFNCSSNYCARSNLSCSSSLVNIWFILVLFPLLFPTIQSPGTLKVNKALQLKSKILFYAVTSCISQTLIIQPDAPSVLLLRKVLSLTVKKSGDSVNPSLSHVLIAVTSFIVRNVCFFSSSECILFKWFFLGEI